MSSTINTITVEGGSSVSVVTAGVQGLSGPNTVLGRSISSSTASTSGSMLVYDHANTEWVDSQVSAAQSLTAKLYNLQFTGGGASVTAILDEDNLGSNSNTALATQQSIKAYVDAQISGQDLDFQGDTGGALAIDLSSETLSILGGTGLGTVGSGNTVTVNIDSTVVTLSGTQTLTNKTLTSPDINGGDISSDTTINKSPVITLAGALTGSATLTTLGDATLTATLASNSIALGTSTTGNYVAAISAGEGLDVSGSGSETATVTISAEDATDSNKGVASFDATDFTVSSGDVTINAERVQDIVGGMVGSNTESGVSVTYEDSDGTLDFNVNDPVITLSGDVSGSATMTNLGDVTITATVQANSVALGTDTTGNYLATLSASNTGIDVANSGAESAAVTVGLNTEYVQDLVGDMVAGNTESGVAVTYDDTNGKIDFNVSDPVITLSGDVAGSATMTNLGDVTITTAVQANSVALGTDTAGNYIATVAAGEGIDVSGSGSESAAITISAEDATSSNKGVASFDATDFTVSSGDVTINAERVQDVVGAMVGSNTESGISVTYEDSDGTLDFNVSDPVITLSGDVAGSATMTNLGDVTITTTIQANSVALGTDTSGAYVATVAAGEGIDVSGSGSESATITISAEDATDANKGIASFDATDFTVSSGDVTINAERVQDIVGAMVSGNTESGIAVAYQDGDGTLDFDVEDFTITLGGDLTGSATVTNLASATLTATIAANSVALGTDTTGNYVATIADSGDGTITVANSGSESAAVTLDVADDSIGNGHIKANAVTLGTQSSGNYVATIAGTANEITVSGSGSETAAVTIGLPDDVTIGGDLTITGDLTVNGDTVELNTTTLSVEDLTIRVGKGATSLSATNGAGIEFGASTSKPTITWDNGNSRLTSNKTFHAASLVGALTGNASTATALETARAIALSGDVVGTANFDGSAGISISTTIQADSVALGTDTTGNYVATVNAGEGIDISGSGSESAGVTVSGLYATATQRGIAKFSSDFSVSSGEVSLGASGVTAGTSGSSTAIPQITVDAKGRITSITTNNVSAGTTSFTLAADSGSNDTFNSSETLTFTGGSGIDTTVSDNAITIAGEDATSSNKGVASFDSTDFSVSSGAVTLQAERIQDIAGAMFSSNTETGITATYQDADGTIDLVIGSGDITNAMLAGSIANSKLASSTIEIAAGGSGSNVALGGTITISGTSNEIEVGESGGTVTVGLPSAAQVSTSLGVGGGSTNGVQISQGEIAIKNGGTQSRVDFYCETSNAHYARLQAPAHSAFSGNVTLTLPASTGNLVGTGDSGTVTNAMLAGSIANSKLANSAIQVVAGGSGSNISLGGTVTFSAGEGIDVSESSGTVTVAAEDATSSNKGVASFDSTDFGVSSGAVTLQAERIQDIVGAMVSSNTETGLAVAYQDSDGTLDFSLSASGVSAASYGSATAIPVLTIDATGRVTAASTASISTSFTLSDGSNTQTVSGGDTLTVAGTSNEVDVAVSATDTLTIGLPNNVTVSNNLTVSGNLVVAGTTTQTGSVVTDNNFTGLVNANTGNSTDFGFYGKYVESSTTKYAGLFYDASTDNTFRLFTDSQTAPSTTVNTGATGYAAAGLVVAGLTASSITIGSTAVTATAAELNILDGVTATAAELNIMDGGTSATSTTLADADRVVVNDNGTMKQVALTDFETYFESALDTLSNVTTVGTLGSLGVTGDLTVNTNVLKVDTSNNRVGILDATPSVTLDVGTATDAIHLPVGTTAQRPTGAAGHLRYNSTTGKFEGYTSSWGDIGGSSGSSGGLTVNTYTANGSTTAFTLSTTPSSEDNLIVFVEGVYMNPNDFTLNGTTLTLDAAPPNGRKIVVYQVTSVVSGNALNHNQFSCNGSTTAFTLGVDPLSENNTQVFLDGVYQQKTDYSVSGTTLTMDTAPANGATLEVMTFLDTAQAVTADASITTAKLADDSVTVDKIQDQGTDGKVLTSTGSGVAWETPAGGAWTVISSSTVSSAVSAVEVTLSGSYTRYAINWQGVHFGSSESFMCFQFIEGSDSSAHSIQYLRNGYGANGSSFAVNQGSSASSNTVYPQTEAKVNSTSGSCSGLMQIHNISGMPAAFGYALTAETGTRLGYTNFAVKLNGASSGDTFGKVSFAPASGNVEAGTFTLYGLSIS